MTGLFGWIPRDRADTAPVLAAMACALQAHPHEAWAVDTGPGYGVGVLDGVAPARVQEWAAPVWSADGRHALWLAGEIFDAAGLPLDVPQDAASPAVRAALLRRLIDEGPGALRAIDGEYQIAWWDARREALSLLSDRFAGLSWYWARTAHGVAFACGVRGVLMAPGVSADPDLESLRDVTTFGGYRLGAHTNIEAVRMFPGALHATVTSSAVHVARYWFWSEVVERPGVSLDEAAETAADLWCGAVTRRLRGAVRAGQTLSGGLDSRAILAEVAAHGVPWTAITYGLPGCDDARLAKCAAATARATWRFERLYAGDWLSSRTAHIQHTDGLIQLSDLMHLETLPIQREHFETHLSGYVGDAVAGPTFGAIDTPESALTAMPYYETPISRGWHGAMARLEAATPVGQSLGSRFLLFDHKLPQSTNRWTVAWRPWLRVRKPFLDYAFFDFCQSLSWDLRGRQRVYEVWLRRHYPAFFARIPNHRTGAPVMAAPWQLQAARAGRVARRIWLRAAGRLGVPHRPWHRNYFDDQAYWSATEARRRITETVLRPDSVACDLLGRPSVAQLLDAWFSRGAAPAQVVGGLYVFERYHQDLAAHLRAARLASRPAGVRGE